MTGIVLVVIDIYIFYYYDSRQFRLPEGTRADSRPTEKTSGLSGGPCRGYAEDLGSEGPRLYGIETDLVVLELQPHAASRTLPMLGHDQLRDSPRIRLAAAGLLPLLLGGVYMSSRG